MSLIGLFELFFLLALMHFLTLRRALAESLILNLDRRHRFLFTLVFLYDFEIDLFPLIDIWQANLLILLQEDRSPIA